MLNITIDRIVKYLKILRFLMTLDCDGTNYLLPTSTLLLLLWLLHTTNIATSLSLYFSSHSVVAYGVTVTNLIPKSLFNLWIRDLDWECQINKPNTPMERCYCVIPGVGHSITVAVQCGLWWQGADYQDWSPTKYLCISTRTLSSPPISHDTP